MSSNFFSKDRIEGYKAFYKGIVNKYGEVFDIGKKYIIDEKYKDYGYHFCKNIEDTLVYYRLNNIEICKVVGSGNIISYDNEYYGVYDVYASSEIEIERRISREELIHKMLSMSYFSLDRVIRFVSLYKLTNDEIALFKRIYRKYTCVIDAIGYYQEKDNKVYERKYKIK